MANIKDALAFLLKNYPVKSDCSNARVTKMLYLADWHQAINHQSQITPINWLFDNYGPFVWDVCHEANKDRNLFNTVLVPNQFNNPKTLIELRDVDYVPVLSAEEKKSIEHVIAETKSLGWGAFIELVYSTYPIMSSERYSRLNLIEKAAEYTSLAA